MLREYDSSSYLIFIILHRYVLLCLSFLHMVNTWCPHLSLVDRDPSHLRRILLLLLAERVYTDLVEPAEYSLGKPEYCLHVTTQLLGDFVSSLYLDNLPRLQERQQKVCQLQSSGQAIGLV